MFKEILVTQGELTLKGHLTYERDSKAWVIFAHGSGSSHLSPRNNEVAQKLNEHGYATLLFDLLTEEEDLTYANRFDIPLLAQRLLLATSWLKSHSFYHNLPIAYFGASTGAAAALVAASENIPELFTVISRGGRPDLAGKEALNKVSVPVILIVGDLDYEVITLNQMADEELQDSRVSLIRGATHLFEEPGTLDKVIETVIKWLDDQLLDRREHELPL